MSRSYMFDDRTTESRRKKREEEQVELRRQRKEELLNKKRNLALSTAQISNFAEMKEKLYSNFLDDIHDSVYEFRSLLSVEDNPPIQSVISSNCMPKFVELLNADQLNHYQLKNLTTDKKELIDKIRVEAAWVFTNIASGDTDQTMAVVDVGAVPQLVNMLLDKNEAVVDQSVWALGNIAGDSEKMRDIVLGYGTLPIVLQIIERFYADESHLKVMRNLTWLLSNLNRGRNPTPTIDNMRAALPIIIMLVDIRDAEIVSDALWALSYVVDVDLGCTDLVLGSNAMGRVYVLLESFCKKLKGFQHNAEDARICSYAISPIIRMLGNIATGTDNQTNAIVKMGFLQFFETIFYRFDHKKMPRIRKEICWTLSNITAGTVDQVQAVIESDLMPMLIDAISNYELFIRKEACWAINNALFHCNARFDWLKIMLDYKLIEALQEFLEAVPNLPEMQCQVLDCFRYALTGGREWAKKCGQNLVLERMIECDVIDTIEKLQDGTEVKVTEKAYTLIVEFFEGTDN